MEISVSIEKHMEISVSIEKHMEICFHRKTHGNKMLEDI
jgi:hypothetical protein